MTEPRPLRGTGALVTGGASGLGLATVEALVARGVAVTIVDLPQSPGKDVASRLGDLVTFGAADVRDAAAVDAALDLAVGRAPLRTLVHCAGRGGAMRVVDKEGNPGSLEFYESIVRINLIGTFNVLSQAAARMARHEPVDGERGVCVLDFGVAKVLATSADATRTHATTDSGIIVGTPRYMSPEQCVGQEVGPQSDLYSLGVLLYEMLAGRPAFNARPPWAQPPERPPWEQGELAPRPELLESGEELVAGRRPVEEAFVARRPAIRLLVVPQRRQGTAAQPAQPKPGQPTPVK